MNENDILGFDPRQLSTFSESNKPKTGNEFIYKTKPEESVSKDGIYRCSIKVIYNPFNFKQSVINQQAYWLEDADGGFLAVSSLTNGDTNCPIFKAWKKCHFADEGTPLWKQAAKEDKGGNNLFNKRQAKYVTVQVMEDKNHPELEGKFMIWKMPINGVWNVIDSKMNPSAESGKCALPIMDFLFGRTLDIEVKPGNGPKGSETYRRDTSYVCEISEDTTCCTNPDKSPLLTSSEQVILDNYVKEVKEIWKEKDPEKRAVMQKELDAKPNTAELKKIYSQVITKLKEMCPNVLELMGYKPWDENLTNRVNHWINIVLDCRIPKQDQTLLDRINEVANNSVNADVSSAPIPSATAFEDVLSGAVEDTTTFNPSSEDDDLPF